MISVHQQIRFLSYLLIIFFLPSCAVNPVTGKKQFMLMSEEQEIAMGKNYDPSVIATFGLYEDEELQNFITEKGSEMAKISHRPNLDYHFRILDSPVVNAFAVPGGYIYFTRGILAQFNSEAEFIGVLGHELGHVTARHSASQQSKQQLSQLALMGGLVISPEFRYFADYAMQGMQLLFLKFSRDNETESDRLGVEYSSKINYDASKMADFFLVLKEMQLNSEQGGVPTFLSTHPDPGDRYTSVHNEAKQWQDSLKYNDWQVNRETYLKRIDGIVYGEDPRQGFVESNTFYHPALKFQFPYPKGWKLINTPLQVQIAPEDGKAIIILSLSEKNNLDQAADANIEALNLQVSERKSLNVNGLPAISIDSKQIPEGTQSNPQDTIRLNSYFIQYDQKIYVFHGITFDSIYDKYRDDFTGAMANFSRLTDPGKLNKQPQRIRIKQVQRSGTVKDVLEYYSIPEAQKQNIAFLNNMNLTDKLERGDLLKIVSD
ncbi:MAG: M48 family metalloprotease [Cyclobacteriaceae bacterium]